MTLSTMNARERMLLAAVGGVFAVLVSVYLIKFIISQRAEYSRQLATTRSKIEMLKKRESERELWSRRDAWLTAKLPPLGDPDVANKALRESVLEIAKKNNVILESPAPGVPTNQPGHISLAIRFEAKGPWEAMLNFLYELQGVEQFTAIEQCEIKVNREDKTQIRATLTIARWFAPKQAAP
jgi:hypothetical protein